MHDILFGITKLVFSELGNELTALGDLLSLPYFSSKESLAFFFSHISL